MLDPTTVVRGCLVAGNDGWSGCSLPDPVWCFAGQDGDSELMP